MVDCLREYRVRSEIELCPSTFSDKGDRAEMVRALEEVGEGIRRLAQKVSVASAGSQAARSEAGVSALGRC